MRLLVLVLIFTFTPTLWSLFVGDSDFKLYTHQTATFGSQKYNLEGDLVVATPADLCSTPTMNLSGGIVFTLRGNCSFLEKALVARAGGAKGVVVGNNVSGNLLVMDTNLPNSIDIPVVFISKPDYEEIVLKKFPRAILNGTGSLWIFHNKTQTVVLSSPKQGSESVVFAAILFLAVSSLVATIVGAYRICYSP